MSYTLILILVLGIPILIYFVVSINRKKKQMKDNEKPGGGTYREGEAKDKDFR